MKHFEELEAEVMTDPARRERVERERTKVVAEQVRDALGELRRQHTQVRSAERGSQLLQVGEPASGDGVDRRATESGAVVSKHGDTRRQRILVLFGERVPPPLELLGDEKLPGHRISIPSEGYTVNKMGHSPAEDVVLMTCREPCGCRKCHPRPMTCTLTAGLPGGEDPAVTPLLLLPGVPPRPPVDPIHWSS